MRPSALARSAGPQVLAVVYLPLSVRAATSPMATCRSAATCAMRGPAGWAADARRPSRRRRPGGTCTLLALDVLPRGPLRRARRSRRAPCRSARGTGSLRLELERRARRHGVARQVSRRRRADALSRGSWHRLGALPRAHFRRYRLETDRRIVRHARTHRAVAAALPQPRGRRSLPARPASSASSRHLAAPFFPENVPARLSQVYPGTW